MIWQALQQLYKTPHQQKSLDVQRVEQLYNTVISQARNPYFYTQCHVSDTPEGHFDMIALHLFLVLQRIKKIPNSDQFSRLLIEWFVDDIDANLREMGTSDLRVGKKVRLMTEALFGRLDAYRTTFEQEPDKISEVITRNVFRARQIPPHVISALIGYFFSQSDYLAKQSDETVLQGRVVFSHPKNHQHIL